MVGAPCACLVDQSRDRDADPMPRAHVIAATKVAFLSAGPSGPLEDFPAQLLLGLADLTSNGRRHKRQLAVSRAKRQADRVATLMSMTAEN
jgi:hypothetical protein